MWFRAIGYLTSQKNGACALGIQRTLALGSYQTAWLWLHKLRRAMVRPERDRLSGWIEVDETYFGGLEEGRDGRGTVDKVLITVAAQAEGSGIGRVRMRVVPDASATSLHGFVKDVIAPRSTVHTDAWPGYCGLEKAGYDHEVTRRGRDPRNAAKLLPRVHRVISLLIRLVEQALATPPEPYKIVVHGGKAQNPSLLLG
jgi:transposase-like protein